MASQNAIIGDDYGMDVPETKVDNTQLQEEKKAAKYSRSTEFKKIQEHMKARIEHYQSFLPSGESVTSVPIAERGQRWTEANTIIMELQAVIDFYETAADIVREAEKK